jgi:plasmid stabilization system protein ParE
MRLEFLPVAMGELTAAVDYYDGCQPGLGAGFYDQVLKLCDQIAREPLLWRERQDGFRRANLKGFPYYIAYFIRGDLILIAAVAHGHRHPDYWRHPDR